jgi:hypothetical protein
MSVASLLLCCTAAMGQPRQSLQCDYGSNGIVAYWSVSIEVYCSSASAVQLGPSSSNCRGCGWVIDAPAAATFTTTEERNCRGDYPSIWYALAKKVTTQR